MKGVNRFLTYVSVSRGIIPLGLRMDSYDFFSWKTADALNFHELETPKTSNPVTSKHGTFLCFLGRIGSVGSYQYCDKVGT